MYSKQRNTFFKILDLIRYWCYFGCKKLKYNFRFRKANARSKNFCLNVWACDDWLCYIKNGKTWLTRRVCKMPKRLTVMSMRLTWPRCSGRRTSWASSSRQRSQWTGCWRRGCRHPEPRKNKRKNENVSGVEFWSAKLNLNSWIFLASSTIKLKPTIRLKLSC